MANNADDILAAVKTQIEAIGLSGASVKVRKKPVRESGDADGLIVVSPHSDETYEPATAENTVFGSYRVLVTIIQPAAWKTTTAGGTANEWRKAVRRKLHKPGLAGAGEVTDVSVQGRPAYGAGEADKNYTYSPLLLTIETTEAREG